VRWSTSSPPRNAPAIARTTCLPTSKSITERILTKSRGLLDGNTNNRPMRMKFPERNLKRKDKKRELQRRELNVSKDFLRNRQCWEISPSYQVRISRAFANS